MNAAGTPRLPNVTGILLSEANGSLIGGINPGEGNIISGNTSAGISVSSSPYAQIAAILSARARTTARPFQRRRRNPLQSTSSLHIGGLSVGERNVIAYSGRDGVRVDGTTPPNAQNYVDRNSIHHNAGKGIENINGGNGELAPPVMANPSAPADGDSVPGLRRADPLRRRRPGRGVRGCCCRQ